jgi:hypothetical protein
VPKDSIRRRWPWLYAVALLIVGTIAVPLAFAGGPAYPNKAKVSGKKLTEWSAEWWQWALSIPQSVSPLFDETGAQVAVGQRGPVWFLCGVFNESGTANRTVAIPEGKAVFFPIVNAEWDNLGVDPPLTVDALHEAAAGFVAAVDPASLVCEVDGVAIDGLLGRRLISKPFEYSLPPGDIYEAFGYDGNGTQYPAVSDGYWVMLKPLSVGDHVLHFAASVGAPYNFSLEITYNITVTPIVEE